MTRLARRPLIALAMLAALLLAAVPAWAQDGPRVDVTVAPEGPVVVGSPVRVTVKVLVPTYMPSPPTWPALEIADAITRRTDRATQPVSERVGSETWSGVMRTWEIVPQRPADYEIGDASVTVTFADPQDNTQTEATVALPAIHFSATVPKGAEGMDPFLAATKLSVDIAQEGPPDAPQPGDSVTLTITTTAAGPPVMLLPALVDRLPAPPGLRAYIETPVLDDAPGAPPVATRTETVTYVIERPGTYRLPAVAVDWWNTEDGTPETASAKAIEIVVGEPGVSGGDGASRTPRATGVILGLVVILLAAGALALIARRRNTGSEAALYRQLRRAVRSGKVGLIRPTMLNWWFVALQSEANAVPLEIEIALRSLERDLYGPVHQKSANTGKRSQFLALVAQVREDLLRRSASVRFPLNP